MPPEESSSSLQLQDDKMWFASLLALGLLGFGVVAMIAYVIAGPDSTKLSMPPQGIATAAGE